MTHATFLPRPPGLVDFHLLYFEFRGESPFGIRAGSRHWYMPIDYLLHPRRQLRDCLVELLLRLDLFLVVQFRLDLCLYIGPIRPIIGLPRWNFRSLLQLHTPLRHGGSMVRSERVVVQLALY